MRNRKFPCCGLILNEPAIIKVRSLKSLGKGSLYWWVEQCVPTLQDQRSGKSRDALRFGFTGWLYLCRLLLNNLCMDDLLVRFTT